MALKSLFCAAKGAWCSPKCSEPVASASAQLTLFGVRLLAAASGWQADEAVNDQRWFLRREMAHPAFKEGFKSLLSAAPGVAAWGLMTGVATMNSSLSGVEALLMCVIVFAGSSQLATLPLLAAGAPMWVILATAFCVNLRFVVFSVHLRPYLMHLPLHERMFRGYLCADLSYMMFVAKYEHADATAEQRAEQMAFLCGNCVCNWVSWIIPSLAGMALSQVVPLSWGLGFAGTLALVGLMCSLANDRLRWVSAGVAGAAAVAAYALPLKLNIVLAIAAATAVCLLLQAASPQPKLQK